MPDHTCRCCHDKRKSTDANGKPNGRAKTACQQLAGCIQPDASPGISSIVRIRGQLNLFGNLVSGAVNAQATPQPSEGIDTTAVAEGPQAGGGASRSPPELALDTQTQATTAEGSAESASAEPGEPRQSSSAAAASATPARTPSRRSGGLFGSGAIAVRAEQREDTAARSAERNASRIIDVANLRADLKRLQVEADQLRAKQAAAAAAAEAKRAAAEKASEIAARVDAELHKKIEDTIADAYLLPLLPLLDTTLTNSYCAYLLVTYYAYLLRLLTTLTTPTPHGGRTVSEPFSVYRGDALISHRTVSE